MKKAVFILGCILVIVTAHLFGQTGDPSFTLPLSTAHHYVTQNFGKNINPLDGKTFFHQGIDLRTPKNTPVFAVLSGTVTETGEHQSYGLYIKIAHANGYETFYGQLEAIEVTTGQQVTNGEVIALSGNSGFSTGPHLHLGIYRNGDAIDPRSVLQF